MNTTLVAILERVPEIGLRRALGARPRDIAAQVLIECGLVGLLAGLIGGSLGVMIVVGVCLGNGWSAVVEPSIVALAPLVGTMIGIVASLYPALRAARVQPISALRRS
jgi:putative ABC transport system permease protein